MAIATGAPPHPILGPAFEADTDRRTRTCIRAGNALEFMPSGAASYRRRWELIEGAARSVDLVSFSMMRDGTSRRLRDLLLAKLRQGVAVRLILDDVAVRSTFSGGILRALAKGGAGVVRYHDVWRALLSLPGEGSPLRRLVRGVKLAVKRRFHEKYLVVDGEEAIVGGINWGDKYADGGVSEHGWRDSDVYVAGPVVADVRRAFHRDFHAYAEMVRLGRAASAADLGHPRLREALARAEELERGAAAGLFPPLAPAGPERLRFVVHRPYDEQRLPLTEAYLLMFRAARRRIWWGCHAVRPPRIVAETLAEAAARGVDVRLVTNSRRASRSLMLGGLAGWMYREASAHFDWLLRHGIRVFEWQPAGAFHSKNLVVDGVAASVGSYNVARGSTLHHAEANVIAYGGTLPGLVEEQFGRDLERCVELRRGDVAAPSPRRDPFRRLLHERDLLVPPELRTPAVAADLAAGAYERG